MPFDGRMYLPGASCCNLNLSSQEQRSNCLQTSSSTSFKSSQLQQVEFLEILLGRFLSSLFNSFSSRSTDASRANSAGIRIPNLRPFLETSRRHKTKFLTFFLKTRSSTSNRRQSGIPIWSRHQIMKFSTLPRAETKNETHLSRKPMNAMKAVKTVTAKDIAFSHFIALNP